MDKKFYIGYDLEKAGYNFSESKALDEANLTLLRGIAADFFKVSREKGKLVGNPLQEDLVESNDPITEFFPIVVMSVDDCGTVSRQYISRKNTMYGKLFEPS